MSPKKSKRSQAAEQLIDNLLDESNSSPAPNYDQPPGKTKAESLEREIAMFNGEASFGSIDIEPDKNIVIEDNESRDDALRLEGESTQAPAFERPNSVMTKMPSSFPTPINSDPKRRAPSVDFGDMSADDPYQVAHEPQSKHQDSEPPVPETGSLSIPPAPFEDESGIDEATVKVAHPMRSKFQLPPQPISQPAQSQTRSEVIPISRAIDRGGATEIRSGVKIPPSPKFTPASGGASSTSIEATLKQSESLRIAQSRITDLEKELERVRRDNESLSTAGDTLRRRADELASKAESLEIQAREANMRLDEEKKVLRGQIQQKDRDSAEMRARVEEIETRLESNFKKIRVRERELEHRLEIVKMESSTLVSTKDKMLLDLKRQIDQLHQESDSAKSKSQELFGQYKEKQETIRRVVRALRIALTILEGDDETITPSKKAE